MSLAPVEKSLVNLIELYNLGTFGLLVENGMVQGFTFVEDSDIFLVIQANCFGSNGYGEGRVPGLNLVDDLSGIITLEGASLAYDYPSSYRT
jgi:hypothetical protein